MRTAYFFTVLAACLAVYATGETPGPPHHTHLDSSDSTSHEIENGSTPHNDLMTSERDSSKDTAEEEYNTTRVPMIPADRINFFVKPVRVTVKPGQNAVFNCYVTLMHSQDSSEDTFCAVWKTNEILHRIKNKIITKNERRICATTISIPNVYKDMTSKLVCLDVYSRKSKTAFLDVTTSKNGDYCNKDDDCQHPNRCLNNVCECETKTPIFISGSSEGCYPVSKLYHSCSYNVQCHAWDNNTVCDAVSNSTQLCLCAPGYEQCGTECIRKVRYYYVFTISRRYQVVWFGILALIPCIIILIVLRLFLKRRAYLMEESLRERSGYMNEVEEEKPQEVQIEKPKEKF